MYDKEYYVEYREKNKGRIAEKNKLWRLNNPEKVTALRQKQKQSGYTEWYQKHYRTTSLSKYSSLKSRAKARGVEFNIPKDKFLQWFDEHPKYCTYCNADLTIGTNGNRKTWLAIDRKDNDDCYVLDNIVIACMRCNLMKSNDISYELMVKIGELIEADRHGWQGEV